MGSAFPPVPAKSTAASALFFPLPAPRYAPERRHDPARRTSTATRSFSLVRGSVSGNATEDRCRHEGRRTHALRPSSRRASRGRGADTPGNSAPPPSAFRGSRMRSGGPARGEGGRSRHRSGDDPREIGERAPDDAAELARQRGARRRPPDQASRRKRPVRVVSPSGDHDCFGRGGYPIGSGDALVIGGVPSTMKRYAEGRA